MELGIDFGASFTKAVLVDKHKIVKRKIIESCSYESNESFLASIRNEFDTSARVSITGGRSHLVRNSSIRIVEELDALSTGASLLSGTKGKLIASTGTGVCILRAGNPPKHLLGTGVGGGTLIGLSRVLLGTDDFSRIESWAESGNASAVNITIGDIIGKTLGRLDTEVTASNLAHLSGAKREDVAAGLFRLVGEVSASIAGLHCTREGSETAVFCGLLSKSPCMQTIINEVMDYFCIKAVFPEEAEFAAALGAAIVSD